jgi:shikimate kinase
MSGVSTGSTNGTAGSTNGRPRVVLVGPPGAGKTVVGRLLADRLDVPFCDTDELVEERAGKPVADIFVDDGEAAFREVERAVVAEALRVCRGVLALGGGAVLAPQTAELLSQHRVVFLDVGLSAAAARIGLGTSRPLLLGNVRGQLKALLDARRPVYLAVTTARVDTDGRSVEGVADAVEELLVAAPGS